MHYPCDKSTPTGTQPYYISSRDGSPLSFAGLWNEWNNIETGEPVGSCTIIITAANEFTRAIHDTMPVVERRGSDRIAQARAGRAAAANVAGLTAG
jgi:putative SOS response-associated peptidase YedK